MRFPTAQFDILDILTAVDLSSFWEFKANRGNYIFKNFYIHTIPEMLQKLKQLVQHGLIYQKFQTTTLTVKKCN